MAASKRTPVNRLLQESSRRGRLFLRLDLTLCEAALHDFAHCFELTRLCREQVQISDKSNKQPADAILQKHLEVNMRLLYQ